MRRGELCQAGIVYIFPCSRLQPQMAAEQGCALPHPPAGHRSEIFPPAGRENGGWAEACGDPYHTAVSNTTSSSMPDILYHPLEMSQLTQACARSLHQLPRQCHPMQEPAPYTTALLLQAQPLSCSLSLHTHFPSAI